jgi:hypothetical protein
MREFDAMIPFICCRFLNIPDNVHIICILYVFVNTRHRIFEVTNCDLKFLTS